MKISIVNYAVVTLLGEKSEICSVFNILINKKKCQSCISYKIPLNKIIERSLQVDFNYLAN